jgi:hypothetical protein
MRLNSLDTGLLEIGMCEVLNDERFMAFSC